MKNRILKIVIILFISISLVACTTKKKETVSLIGEWQSPQGTLFTFDEKGKYGYYKDGEDRKDNYYKGAYTYQKGIEAMKELGITNFEFAKLEKSKNIKQEDIYAVKMKMEILFSEGRDKSANLDKEGYYYFAFYLLPQNKAMAVNMSTFDQIELERLQ